MSPAVAQLVIFGVEEAITLAPGLFTDLKALFASDTPPTAEQFAALRAKIEAETYEGFVPATSLTPASEGPASDQGYPQAV